MALIDHELVGKYSKTILMVHARIRSSRHVSQHAGILKKGVLVEGKTSVEKKRHGRQVLYEISARIPRLI